VITDSDEYLVVEMQPAAHERFLLRQGSATPKALARSLSEWTTACHRDNVRHELVFHAADIPDAVREVGAEADAFLAQVSRRLNRRPKPHRNHPYWIGAITAHKLAISEIRGSSVDARALPLGRRSEGYMRRLRNMVLGRAPNVRPWHPRWPDYRQVARQLRRLLAGTRGRLCIVSTITIQADDWPAGTVPRKFELGQFMRLKPEKYMPLVGQFDGCLLLLSDEEFGRGQAGLYRLRPLLTPRGFIVVCLMNSRGVAYHGGSFGDAVVFEARGGLHLGMRVTDLKFVSTGRLRSRILRQMITLYRGVQSMPWIYYPAMCVMGPLLAAGTFLGNLACLRGHPQPPHGHASSVHMVLRIRSKDVQLPEFVPDVDLYANAGRYAIGNLSPRRARVSEGA
jgi:hypothetical protein